MKIIQDIRFALRAMRRQSGLTIVIVLTLGLAIGANTAIFSLMDALLLQSLPVHDPQGLYLVHWSANHRLKGIHSSSSYGDCLYKSNSNCSFSYPVYQMLQQQAHDLAGLTASGNRSSYNVSGNGQASLADGQVVAGNYFNVVGVQPAIGRLFTTQDDIPSAPLTTVLSYGYWQSAFAGSRGVLGQIVDLNNVPVTIIGVAEPRFTDVTPGRTDDLWLTLSSLPRLSPNWRPQRLNADTIWLTLFARMKPGISPASAQAEASGLFRNAMLAGPGPMSVAADAPQIELQTAQDHLVGARSQYSQSLTVLMWTVGVILLLACANVAGLLLGKATSRQKELAVRRALGAGAGRILRQLLTESLVLAMCGGALGLALAWWGAQALMAVMSSASYRPLGLHVALDPRVLLFTLGATVATGLLFGLAPGLRGARLDLSRSLKDSVGNTGASRRWRGLHLGNALVVAQIGLCVVVLAGAGLLVRTLNNLRGVNPGFDTSHILLFSLQPALTGYKGAAVDRLYQNVQERLTAQPGVEGVSYAESALLSNNLSSTSYKVDPRPGAKEADADIMPVGIGYFATLHIPLRLGRDFIPTDFVPETDTPPAAKPAAKVPAGPPQAIIVNQMFVRKYLGLGNPVGRVFGAGSNGATGGWKIVGVVGDTKYQDLRSAVEPTTYTPSSEGYAVFEVRTAGDPMTFAATVRQIVRSVDPNLPVSNVSTQSGNVDRLLFRERLLATLSSCFAGLALLLACIGLYGLLSQDVTRRTREIGIRMALGAQRSSVLAMIVGGGLGLTLVGLALGIGGAWGLTRYLHSLLFGVNATDSATLAGVGLLLTVIALAACLIPAQRAARVDPLVALRYE